MSIALGRFNLLAAAVGNGLGDMCPMQSDVLEPWKRNLVYKHVQGPAAGFSKSCLRSEVTYGMNLIG